MRLVDWRLPPNQMIGGSAFLHKLLRKYHWAEGLHGSARAVPLADKWSARTLRIVMNTSVNLPMPSQGRSRHA